MQINENARREVIHSIPKSHRIYGTVVHWVTILSAVASLFMPIFILANPANNVLNPNRIFGAIFNGASPEEIWAMSTAGGFPGAHFYLQYPGMADSWAMFFMNLGCAVGFIALVPTVLYQICKEKDWFCAILGTLLAALIFLSMTGMMQV